ncbi:MAG: hypothetical protein WC742_03370 [Gallionellaceae bacterium]
MKKINSGKLRAIGYDARARMLQVQREKCSYLLMAPLSNSSSPEALSINNIFVIIHS